MQKIDLHVHSTYSDGTLTPRELVKHAKKLGISAFALTDHDTVEGVGEAVAAGAEYGIEVIPGVELSTSYHEKEIHIVGLYIHYADETLKKELDNLKDSRLERNLQICSRFAQYGIHISYEEMLAAYPDAVITRAHFADYLVKKKLVHSRNEAFDRYLGDNRPCFVHRKKMQPQHAIRLIQNAGGIAILAHPVLYHLGSAQMAELLSHLCACGLTGLEAVYSTYSRREELQMRKLAEEYHLLISGGSDYHGANKPHIEMGSGLGSLLIPYEILEALQKKRTVCQDL